MRTGINIRELTVADSPSYLQLINENRNRLLRYFPITSNTSVDEQSALKYLQDVGVKTKHKELYHRGIFYQKELIGVIIIKNIDWNIQKCELAYYIDKQFEGKGIMTNVLGNTVDYCFEYLKMKKLYMRIDPDNLSSKKIALKNGFEKEGLLKKEFKIETGELIDLEYFGLINSIEK